MFARWTQFYLERCAVHAVAVAAGAIAIDLITQYYLGASVVRLSWGTVLIVVTSLLVSAALRCSDEMRDVEVDRKYFPDRPLVTGRITRGEVIGLAVFAAALSLLPNLFWTFGLLELLATLAFLYLITCWYFLPKLFSSNRFLAVLSNLPFFFFLYFYMTSVSARFHGLEGPVWGRAVIAAWMLLPLHSYEFARKTFLPSEERAGYQTYSALVGFKQAAALSFGFALGHYAVIFALSPLRRPSGIVLGGLGVLLFYYAVVLARFVVGRCAASRELENTSGFYSLGATVLLALGALQLL